MGIITPEQLAELDIQDANDNAAALQEDTQIDTESSEPSVEESTTEETSEAKPKEVIYREEIVEDDTSESEDETEDKGTEPLQLADDTLVIDPLTGDQVTGRELKNRMLMQSDYTKKTQELAQMRTELETRLQNLEAKAEEPKQEEEEYDPSDPFQVAQKKTNDELKETQKMLAATQTQLREMNEAIQLREHQSAMESFDKIKTTVLDTHKDVLTEDDIEPIGRQFMVEAESNPRLTYEDTATAYADRIRQAEERGVKKWKDKYVVTEKETGSEGVSPGPSTPPKLKLRSKSIIEAMDAEDREYARKAATGG